MRHSQLEFDFDRAVPVPSPGVPASAPSQARRRRGQVAYLSGRAAESSVERSYCAQGYMCLHRRWRGPGGEIDLIFQSGDRIVMVEVKAADSHDRAAERISPRQVQRIARSAEAFLCDLPLGSVSDFRIDVALVDRIGRVSIRENAFAGWL